MLRVIFRLTTGLLLMLPSVAAAAQLHEPLAKAYAFLYEQMDKYAQGTALRLPQSYVPTATFSNGDISYTYDDAVMIVALLARGSSGDIVRVRVLGDSLLYLQAHDSAHDGRLRDAHHAKYMMRSGVQSIANAAAHTGNLAWAGMAFAQLYRATNDPKYLKAALTLANFICGNFYDGRGIGGYTGGFEANGAKVQYKSTEHNIDLYALFTMLAQLTGEAAWKTRADHALTMIAAMWDAKGFFWIGTALDGQSVNKLDPIPEDVQTWSFLSLRLARYQSSIDWALANLSAASGPFKGLSFAANDRSGVWFEGTAHAALALAVRDLGHDAQMTSPLLSDIEIGQARAPNADSPGIDAASKDGLKTGDGADDRYYAAPHVAATAWYCLAKQSANPFRLLK